MSKPMTLNESFPTTEGICPDAYSLAIVSPAYASSTGELNAVLQYCYQSIMFEKHGMKEIAETLQSIGMAEMLHLKLLGQTISALGACPVYCQNPPSAFNFYSTKFVSYSRNLIDMIDDDILSEKHSVCQYTKMVNRLKNEQVKAIVSRILEDEKLHLDNLKEILSKLKC